MDKFQEKKKRAPLVLSSFSSFFNEVYLVLKSPAFLLLTFMGNGIILVSSCLFYYFEKASNPNIKIFLDALWWGVATATTTGYGDITPVTIPGKILGICLMLVGLAFFGMFTALFAEAILTSSRKNKS